MGQGREWRREGHRECERAGPRQGVSCVMCGGWCDEGQVMRQMMRLACFTTSSDMVPDSDSGRTTSDAGVMPRDQHKTRTFRKSYEHHFFDMIRWCCFLVPMVHRKSLGKSNSGDIRSSTFERRFVGKGLCCCTSTWSFASRDLSTHLQSARFSSLRKLLAPSQRARPASTCRRKPCHVTFKSYIR